MSEEMTKEQARNTLRNAAWLGTNEDRERIERAVELLCGEPCEDAVSRGVFEQVMWERDVAIDQLKELGYGFGEKPKMGHWIIIDDCEKFIAKCSECGRIEDSRMISKYPYCHCGAKMVEPQERSE
jgi:hypothetical protein